MPNKEETVELAFKERVRDVIQANGKAPAVSKKTGIPLGTLNKYVAMRSVPSVINAAKIAKMAGISLEELATGASAEVAVSDSEEPGVGEDAVAVQVRDLFDPHLFERLYIAVDMAHKEAGISAPPHRIALATGEALNALRSRVASLSDEPIVEAVIPVIVGELRRRLEEAKVLPGSGKRTAS